MTRAISTPTATAVTDEAQDLDFWQLIDVGAQAHYEDAVLYDHEYRRRRRDATFYRALADELIGDRDRPVLDVACGSGRVTSELLRGGHGVIAFDLSRPMLQRASARIARLGRARRARVSLFCADMRQFRLGARFPLVVSAFNSFEHLYTRTDVEAMLASVRRVLEPDGVLAFDVQNPDLEWLVRDPDKRWARTVFSHPVTKRKLVYTTNHVYDPVSQICLIRIFYTPLGGPGEERVVYLSQRKFFPAELESVLWANGFRVQARYGDFQRDALGPDAESQVLICRPT